MDDSAFKILLDCLEKSRSALDTRLSWATWAVVIGVVLEVVFVIWEYREENHAFKRGIIRPPSKPNKWLFVGVLLGSGLVAGGVSGELYFNAQIGSIETRIRSTNELRAALLSLEAATASQKAEEAKRATEIERAARIEVEASVAWRRLTKKQISQMGSKLAAYPRQRTALVYNVNDVEAYGFASDIDVALHEVAKWNVGEPQSVLIMREGPVKFGTNPPLERGVEVRSTSDEPSTAAAKAIREELTRFGFDNHVGEAISSGAPRVQILVQPRPEGAQGEAKLRKRHPSSAK